MPTTVVNAKTDDFDVYIGRANNRARNPACRKTSKFHNPFKHPGDGTREECIAKYEEHLRRSIEMDVTGHFKHELLRLRGQRLGCWCKPEACHGDVILKVIEELTTKPPEIHEVRDALQQFSHAIGHLRGHCDPKTKAEMIAMLEAGPGRILERISLASPAEFF
jgi:hypothetical protein